MTAAGTEQRLVNRLTRASGSNFYYSFLFLPRDRREAIHSVYAFCRAVDDSVDAAPDPAQAASRVAFWRNELSACFDGAPTDPIARSLAAHLKQFPIQRRHLEEIIEGVAMDVQPSRYETFEDLRRYCYRVASAVGLVCIEIFGYTDSAAREYATNLGLAFQLTNILRDVKPDAERGRIYVPQEDLRRFACPEGDLSAPQASDAFRSLMRFEVARTKGLFARAASSLPPADRRTLFPAEIMRAIYAAILERISLDVGSVLAGKVRLSRARKLGLAAGIYLSSRLA